MLQPSDEELMGYDSVSDDEDLDDEEDILDEEEDFDEDGMGEPKSKPKDRRRGASAGSEIQTRRKKASGLGANRRRICTMRIRSKPKPMLSRKSRRPSDSRRSTFKP